MKCYDVCTPSACKKDFCVSASSVLLAAEMTLRKLPRNDATKTSVNSLACTQTQNTWAESDSVIAGLRIYW